MPNFAVIDLGSNSVRLQIAQPTEKGYEVLYEAKEPVRLGEDVFLTRKLAPDAIERTITALKGFSLKMATYKVARMRAVATSAVRSSTNKEYFLERVRSEVGINFEVLTGKEEGKLIGLSLLRYPHFADQPYLLIDVGGGSTEISCTDGKEILYTSSLELGAVRLTEMFIHSDPIRREEFIKLKKHIASSLKPVIGEIRARYNYAGAVGTAGTISALAKIWKAEQNQAGNKEDQLLERAVVRDILEDIRKLNYVQRLKIKGIDKKRADIIVPGAAVLEQFLIQTELENIWVSPKGLKDGLMTTLIPGNASTSNIISTYGLHSDQRNSDIETLADTYDVDKAHSSHVATIAMILYEQMAMLNLTENTDEDKFLLYSAAKLHDIGHNIDTPDHHKHTDYLIRNSTLLKNLDENTRLAIASIARAHRLPCSKILEKLNKRYKGKALAKILQLGAILRIADGLDADRKQGISNIEAALSKSFLLSVSGEVSEKEKRITKEKSDLFTYVFGKKVDILAAGYREGAVQPS